MRCEDASALLIDDGERRRSDVAAHLAACDACRGIAEVDAAARGLRRLDPVPPLPSPDPSVELARRRRVRWAWSAGALAATALVVAVLGGDRSVESAPADVFVERAGETAPLPVAAPAPADPAEGSIVQDLLAHTQSLLRDQPARNDPLYASFGDLPRWVALPELYDPEVTR